MQIRQAELTDIKRVFELSNDPLVRSVSFNKEPIVWTQHVEWFTRTLADPQSVFLIGMEGGDDDDSFVGQVRLKPLDGSTYEISISIRDIYRGQGKGRELVTGSIRWFASVHKTFCIVASIEESNNASSALFKACGFEEDTDLSFKRPGVRVLSFKQH